MYFGITSRSLKERFTEHKQNAKTKKNKLYNSIRKYGIENFKIEEYAYAFTWENVCQIEKELIKQYNSFSNGYNQTLGGEGTSGFWVGKSKPKEQIDKMKETKKKRI